MFDQAYAFIAKWEGGYVNDPADPGGETKYGISKRAYPDLDIGSLTREQAREIYRRDYWLAAKCDHLPGQMALVHFDCAVNQGVGRAAIFLQDALGVATDGIIGPITIAVARQAEPCSVVNEYCALRMEHYGRLSTFRRFGLGWARRLFDAHATALTARPAKS